MRATEWRCVDGLSECGLKRERAVRGAMGLRMVPMPPVEGGGWLAGRGLAVSPPKNSGKNDG